jgi:hypothetical protein
MIVAKKKEVVDSSKKKRGEQEKYGAIKLEV